MSLRGAAHIGKQRGSKNSQAQLTEEQVLEICKLDHLTAKTVAALYPCSASTVRAIRRGDSWGWLTGRGRQNTKVKGLPRELRVLIDRVRRARKALEWARDGHSLQDQRRARVADVLVALRAAFPEDFPR